MNHIKEVQVMIIEVDDEGIVTESDLCSPTIDLAIEKLGAWEREFYRQREADESNLSDDIQEGDSEKKSDLEDAGVKIEE